MVLFFSFNSINRALTNPKVAKHVDALFGKEKADKLRATAKSVHTEEREELLIEEFLNALSTIGYEYVVPYVFEREDKDRTSHYLIFITKHRLGFSVMKEIMYKLSEDKTQGVARFGLVRPVSRRRTPLLALMNTPLNDFADQLCDEFAGQAATRKELQAVYDRKHPRNLLVDKNWRNALSKLEDEGRIIADPPLNKRPKRNGKTTFSPTTKVTFSKK